MRAKCLASCILLHDGILRNFSAYQLFKERTTISNSRRFGRKIRIFLMRVEPMTYAQQLSYKRLIGAKATKLGSGLEWLYVLMRNDRDF